MTDPRHLSKPTPTQLRLLRELALERGESFVMPKTRTEASAEIRRLSARKRTPYADVRRERADISKAFAIERGGAAAIRPGEVAGYGSSARWTNGRER
jgi:hypothetical protein